MKRKSTKIMLINIRKRHRFHLDIKKRRIYKLTILTSILTLIVIGMLKHVYNLLSGDRRLPPQTITKYDRALRGNIVTLDGYTLSQSKKIYSASIYGKSIYPEKRELFIKLFSIYSGMSIDEISKKMRGKDGKFKKGRIILSKNIDASTAIYLKELAYKLKKLKVFQRVKLNNGIVVLYGLDIVEAGEKRVYPLSDALSPVLGYTREDDTDRYRRVLGIKGLEKRYEKYLNDYKDGYIKGLRDVSGNLILNKSSIKSKRVDGYTIHLNTPMLLQRMLEKITDEMREVTNAKEIIAAVMESKTGKIRALASSERYSPAGIKQEDIPKLIPKAVRYPYEPGSVMKPITLSIAMELKRVTPHSWFKTFNGSMRISKRFTIHDDEPFDSMDATDIIIHSSNIGITLIGWRLSGKELYDGLMKFGFNHKSGVDLSSESRGMIRSPKMLDNKVNRATQSYGYGMKATFMQLLKAYSAFNNDGITVTPYLVDYIESADGKKYRLRSLTTKNSAISPDTANKVANILRQVVTKGTGKATIYPGLDIGGKTGTSHISRGKGYTKSYHSSFYGFANDDKGHRYTIGVLVIEPSQEKHFASQSAVPTFKKIIDALVDIGYLKPKLDIKMKKNLEKEAKKRKEVIIKKRKERTRKIKQELKRKREKIKRYKKSSTAQLFRDLKYGNRAIQKPKPKHAPIHKPIKHEPAPNLDLF